MAITVSESTKEPRSFSTGPVKFQLMDYVANSDATSGTVTANKLIRLDHIMLLGAGGLKYTAAPTVSGNVATLAFTVPAETVASRTYQSSMTLTAVANLGALGNNITLAFTGGATAGAEVVTVSGTAISIQIENGVSTATQVKAAYDASAAAVALATMALVGGHEADTVATASALALQNGVTGGARGTLLAIGV